MSKPLRILYAIQGTGNGHVARAREIIPILQEFGQLDIVLSGDQSEVALPVEPRYRSKGLTFIYDSKGAVSLWKTLWKNNLLEIYREIMSFPVHHYDVIINDFEFITAWTCRLQKKKCIGLGHQASFSSERVPRPEKRSWWGELILKYYAPVSHPFGFHFKAYDQNIFQPVIRSEIRKAKPVNKGHYVVYLPAFGDQKLVDFLSRVTEVEWHVFSKTCSSPEKHSNILLQPIDNEDFISRLVSAAGILTSAGFETPAEALYLGKKVAVVPIKRQYEQYCNAAAIKELGVPVFHELNDHTLDELRKWVNSENYPSIDFPDQTREVIESLLKGL